jgi:hypothetical protein
MMSSTLYPIAALSSQMQQYIQHYRSAFLNTLSTNSQDILGCSVNDKTERFKQFQKKQEERLRYYDEQKKKQQQKHPDYQKGGSACATMDPVTTFEQSAQQLIATFMKDPHLMVNSAAKHPKFKDRQSTPLWALLEHLNPHLTAHNSFILDSSVGTESPNIDRYIITSCACFVLVLLVFIF